MLATPKAVMSVDTGNKCIILEKTSTTVRIAFLPDDSGNGPIMSIDMVSHGFSGTL